MTYLEVCELWMVEVWVNMQRGAHHKQRLKLVQRGADVASESQAPDFQKSFQIKKHSEGNLVEVVWRIIAAGGLKYWKVKYIKCF